MTAGMDWHLARALLEWQVELGVTEAIGSQPLDRLAPVVPVTVVPMTVAPVTVAASVPVSAPAPAPRPPVAAAGGGEAGAAEQAAALAGRLAAAARDLADLAEALAAFEGCDLRRGAQSCVFADGDARARVMIVGEGPGADEDRAGLPFVGRAGQMLDRMFAAIGLGRSNPDPSHALYITNTVPWRPPGNREPTAAELALLRPFLQRHIELADPDVLVLMGNVACEALLGQRGILKLRGTWAEVMGRPALAMLHPAYLLRNPEAKREAWADLLALKAWLAKNG